MKTIRLAVRVRPAIARRYEKVAKLEGAETLSSWIRRVCDARAEKVEALQPKAVAR